MKPFLIFTILIFSFTALGQECSKKKAEKVALSFIKSHGMYRNKKVPVEDVRLTSNKTEDGYVISFVAEYVIFRGFDFRTTREHLGLVRVSTFCKADIPEEWPRPKASKTERQVRSRRTSF